MKMCSSVEFFENKRNNYDLFFPNIVHFGASFIQKLVVQLIAIEAIANETTIYIYTIAHTNTGYILFIYFMMV